MSAPMHEIALCLGVLLYSIIGLTLMIVLLLATMKGYAGWKEIIVSAMVVGLAATLWPFMLVAMLVGSALRERA